ncbi:MAG: hypothetical protein ACOX2M_03760 [Fastidiosipilaceae bacterium]|jgi:hypothetical protein
MQTVQNVLLTLNRKKLKKFIPYLYDEFGFDLELFEDEVEDLVRTLQQMKPSEYKGGACAIYPEYSVGFDCQTNQYNKINCEMTAQIWDAEKRAFLTEEDDQNGNGRENYDWHVLLGLPIPKWCFDHVSPMDILSALVYLFGLSAPCDEDEMDDLNPLTEEVIEANKHCKEEFLRSMRLCLMDELNAKYKILTEEERKEAEVKRLTQINVDKRNAKIRQEILRDIEKMNAQKNDSSEYPKTG